LVWFELLVASTSERGIRSLNPNMSTIAYEIDTSLTVVHANFHQSWADRSWTSLTKLMRLVRNMKLPNKPEPNGRTVELIKDEDVLHLCGQ